MAALVVAFLDLMSVSEVRGVVCGLRSLLVGFPDLSCVAGNRLSLGVLTTHSGSLLCSLSCLGVGYFSGWLDTLRLVLVLVCGNFSGVAVLVGLELVLTSMSEVCGIVSGVVGLELGLHCLLPCCDGPRAVLGKCLLVCGCCVGLTASFGLDSVAQRLSAALFNGGMEGSFALALTLKSYADGALATGGGELLGLLLRSGTESLFMSSLSC